MFLSLGKKSGGRKAGTIERMEHRTLTLRSQSHQQKKKREYEEQDSYLLAQFRRKLYLEIDDLDSFTFRDNYI